MNSVLILQTALNSLLLLILIISPGCSDDRNIGEDKLVIIYTDLLIAQDTLSLSGAGLDSLRLSVLQKHNVDEKDYNAAIKYYNEDLKRWEGFFDKVTKHLEKLQGKRG